MARYAVINNNAVVNVVVSEGYTEVGWILLDDESPVGKGWLWDGLEFSKPAETPVYRISEPQVLVDGAPGTSFAGNYYVDVGRVIQFSGTLRTPDNTTPNITIPVTLKMPLVRHSNGVATQDEIYLNVTLNSGTLNIQGTVDRSGDWKVLIHRVNEALERIGAGWLLEHTDVTFLV